MKTIETNPNLVAYCGLYCGACRAYLKGKCPGCETNEKASWCKIRICCQDNHYSTCADCREFSQPMDCKKFNTRISRIIAFIFRSNRPACLNRIKEIGKESFAREMSEQKIMTLKR